MRLVSRTLPILVALGVIVAGVPAPAAADPIPLVSGTIRYTRGAPGELSAQTLDGAQIDSIFGNFVREFWDPDHACTGCTPGSIIALSQTESFTNEDDAMAALGTVSADGVDYFVQSLDFQIAAASVALPDSANTTVDVSSPFSFLGLVTARSIAGTAIAWDLTGSGIATATFANNDWTRTAYEFGAATPEPGTLLLLGGPVLALLRRRSRSEIGTS